MRPPLYLVIEAVIELIDSLPTHVLGEKDYGKIVHKLEAVREQMGEDEPVDERLHNTYFLNGFAVQADPDGLSLIITAQEHPMVIAPRSHDSVILRLTGKTAKNRRYDNSR